MELTRLQSLVCRTDLRAIGLPTAPSEDLFPYLAWLPRPTVPRPLRNGFILSCLVSPSECLRLSCLAPPFGGACPASGFLPSSRRHWKRPLGAGERLRPLRSVRRFSQPPDGLLRFQLCGLIASRNHVQGSPFRGFSRSIAVLARRQACAPLPLLPIRSPACRLPRMNRSTSRPCSMNRCVPRRSVISLPPGRSPLRLPPPSGPHLPAVNPVPRVLRS